MKTRFLPDLLVLFVAVFFSFPAGIGQTAEQDSTAAALNYDVQRVYDKDGNLIYYDSTVVGSSRIDTGNSEFDSLLTAWKEENRNIRYSIRFPSDSFSYSFELPDKFFEFAPEYEYDIEVPKVDSLLKGFDYYFSLTPSDSCNNERRDLPFFEFHGRVPEVDPAIDERIWEMKRRMLKFQQRIMDQYKEWIYEQPEGSPEEKETPQEEPIIPKKEDIAPLPRIDV